ncbi:MAG: BamA/TamA family outer membrane protein [Bacteroidales bacterium]
MKRTISLLIFLLLAAPGVAAAQHHDEPQAENVNSRYTVESVSLAGVEDSSVSKTLRDDMQKLVGQKFDQAAANKLADRLREELKGYSVDVKVGRGTEPEHVKVTFQVERRYNRRFDVSTPLVTYYENTGWSGAIDLGGETHHNYFSAGLVGNADELLERYAGYRLRYEHRRVGTEKVRLGVEFAQYHETFEQPTQDALVTMPWVPGVYRLRQNFAPSVSVLPVPVLKVSFGVGLQDLDVDVPVQTHERAYAFTFGAQVRQRIRSASGVRQAINVDYGLRKATESLDSTFIYTRHLVSGDYTVSVGRNLFGFHGRLGHISGAAPLFERFSLGNSALLRGWNKFDVAPAGGSRLAYGSLEYRYSVFQAFYDFGTVWDEGQPVRVKHGLGVGIATRHGFFMSVAFPVRVHDVSPVFMFGIRY